MRRFGLGRLLGSVSVFSLSAVLAAPVYAQDTVQLGTVTVTGEKVERAIEETASSVEVFTEEDIDNKVEDATVADIVRGTPNVLYPGTISAPVIRGLDAQGPNFGSTAFFGGTIPRATVSVDGHYLNFYELVFGGNSIWDVESIEVFRGPQTTSQGANAIAGSIVVLTKDPTFTPQGAAQVQYGSRNMKRGSLALSGPISNQLAGRVSVDYFARDTFIDYVAPNFADTDQDTEIFDGRAKLLFRPDSVPGLEAKLTYARNQTTRPTFEAASQPYDDLDSTAQSNPTWDGSTDSIVGDISYDLGGGLTLINQSQYADLSTKRETIPFNNGSATIDQQNFYNESRIVFGDEASRKSGVAGIFYSHTTSDDILFLRGISDFDDEKNSLGIYSEVSYRLTDRWTLTGGLRYQRDHVERAGTTPFAAVPLDFDETFDAWLPKVSLAYEVVPDVTVGALVVKGYNPGGVNLSFAQRDYITFVPEEVWDYELFTRASLLDNRLTFNANVFYSEYTDAQRLLPDFLGLIEFGAVVFNADEAETYGLEASLDYEVRENFRLRAGLGLLRTEIVKFTAPEGDIREGNEFGFAPSYMFNIGADWDITPKITLSADVRHTDGYFSTDKNDPAFEIDPFTIANAKVTYRREDNIELFVFANNIFDERSATFRFQDRSINRSGILGAVTEPFNVGVGTKVTF